jgi:putative redox protein
VSLERGGTNEAVARWAGGWRVDVDAGGFQLVVDEPVEVGGTGAGPMPTDLLLAALSSCYALALAWAARKAGHELPDVSVRATGTYRGQTFSALVLTVATTTAPELLEPLLEPAMRVCYVSNTIAGSPPITVELAAAE